MNETRATGSDPRHIRNERLETKSANPRKVEVLLNKHMDKQPCMPPRLFFETLSLYSGHTADNRVDVVEVRTCPAHGRETAYRFLEDKEFGQPGRHVGTYVAPGSGTYEVKNSTTTHTTI